jgi:hypothetical protein
MEIDRRPHEVERRTFDDMGRSRQTFYHEFMSCWEFTNLALEPVGVLTRVEGPLTIRP